MYRFFEFDGEKSIDKDFHVVYFPDEYFDVITYGGRSVDLSKNKPKIEDGQLEFSLMLAKMDQRGKLQPIKQKDMNNLSQWLIKDDFKPMRFSLHPDKIYYVILKEMSPLQLDRVGNGFLEVTFIANTNHAFTNERVYNCVSRGLGEIEIFSEQTIGQYNYPRITIQGIRDNDEIKILNSGTGQQLTIKNVKNEERIYIDTENKIIEGRHGIFKDFNREWLKLRKGSNILHTKGAFEMVIKTEYGII